MKDMTTERAPQGAALPSRHGSLGPSLSVTGDVLAGQDLLVEGRLHGNLDMPEHALTIAPGARVEGRVFARAVTIAGTFVGELTATTRVQVIGQASVDGEVTCPRLLVEDGAVVHARVDTRRTESAVKVARYRLEKRMSGSAAR